MLRVAHPEVNASQHEFRFVPYSGAQAYRDLRDEQVIWLSDKGQQLQTSGNGYTLYVKGYKYTLTEAGCQILSGLRVHRLASVVEARSKGLAVIKRAIFQLLAGSLTKNVIHTFTTTGSPTPTASFTTTANTIFIGAGASLALARPQNTSKTEIRSLKEDPRSLTSDITSARYFLNTSQKPRDGRETISPSDGSGSGLKVQVDWWSNGAATWQITDGGKGYKNGESVVLRLSGINGALSNARVTIQVVDKSYSADSLNKYDAISDYWKHDAESSSHADSPEHEIVSVNEIMTSNPRPTYPSMAMAGIRINASSELNQFSNLSMFVKEGIKVQALIAANQLVNRDLNADPISTNLFPEIAYDLMTSEERGAAEFIGPDQVNVDELRTSAKFCRANGLFWDGVIAQPQNLREFFFEMAAYHLLDFKIVGGQFSLYPTVPFNETSFVRLTKVKPDIKALFTDGNVKDMEVTWLAPEERQMFRGTAIWRDDTINGFPRQRVYSAYLKNGGSDIDPEEVFDMSGFCTSEAHAKMFVHFALMLRKYVDHSLKFQTTPQAAMTLQPGDYFRFVSHSTHTSRFDNGTIAPDGTIQTASPVADNQKILYWTLGTEGVKEATLQVSDGKATQAELHNSVFTVVRQASTNLVYKCESLSYDEDGLVEVEGTHMELNSDGQLLLRLG